jgi:sporulation protein YlmC with PRC-barrel domain
LFLSELLGTRVVDASNNPLGRIVDLVVDLDDPAGLVRRVLISQPRHASTTVGWSDLSFEQAHASLTPAASMSAQAHLTEAELRLARDVLDTQVIDILGKRVARVSDVLLTDNDPPSVTDVEVGSAAVLRRLGLGRLAGHAHADTIAWGDLHLTSQRGHELQLRSTSGRGVRRLDHEALAVVVSRVPPHHAAEILRAVTHHTASRLAESYRDPIGRSAHRHFWPRLWRRRQP